MTPSVMRALGIRSFPRLESSIVANVQRASFCPGLHRLLLLIFLLVGLVAIVPDNLSLGFEQDPIQSTSQASDYSGSDTTSFVRLPDYVVGKIASETKAASIAGNNAWIMTCSALVFFMIAPGLALF